MSSNLSGPAAWQTVKCMKSAVPTFSFVAAHFHLIQIIHFNSNLDLINFKRRKWGLAGTSSSYLFAAVLAAPS